MSDTADLPSRSVRLTESDVLLLVALIKSGRSRAVTLSKLIETVDWIDRAMPAFEDFAFGLQRLSLHGYVEVVAKQPLKLRPTGAATDLAQSVHAPSGSPYDLIDGMREALNNTHYSGQSDSRSPARFPGVSEKEFQAVVDAKRAETDLFIRYVAAPVARLLRFILGGRGGPR